MTCGIYMIQNKVNNKIYIGQAVDIERRWEQHKANLRGNCNSPNKHLQNAWNRDGEVNFEFTVICECNENQLNTMEEYYIFELMSYDDRVGYNKKYGGNSGRFTEETKKKIGEANKGKHRTEEAKKKMSETSKRVMSRPEVRKKLSESIKNAMSRPEVRKKLSEAHIGMKRKPHSEETKRKMSESAKGKIMSEASRKKMSESRKGKPLSKETRKKLSEVLKGKPKSEETRKKMSEAQKGKIISEETRKKFSEAHKGKTLSEEQRKKISESLKGENNPRYWKGKLGAKHHSSIPVVQLSLDGELVNVYGSACEAGRAGFIQQNITHCCKGKLNKHRGYKWMYLSDYEAMKKEG